MCIIWYIKSCIPCNNLGIPVGIVGSSLTVLFYVTTGIVKKLLNTTRKKKKKHNKIIVLARNKLNIIETLMSQSLIDFDVSREDFKKIIDEKEKYEQIKENIKNAKNIGEVDPPLQGDTTLIQEDNQVTKL